MEDLNQTKKKKEDETSTLVTPTGQPEVLPPPSATGLGGDAAATISPPPQTDTARRGSGLFTNVRAYLDANKGAGQQLAQGIESKAKGQAQTLTSEVQETQGTVSNIQGIKDKLAQANTYAQQIQQNPTEALSQIDDITALRTGAYGADIDQYQGQGASQLKNVREQLGLVAGLEQKAGTEQGRFGLLEDTYATPQYSEGAKRLDQLFLQTEGSNTLGNLQRTLAQIRGDSENQAQQLENQYQTSLAEAQTLIPEAQRTIQNTIGSLGAGGGGELGRMYSEFTEAQRQAAEEQARLVQQAKEGFASGRVDEETLKRLGLNPDQRIYNVNLADFATGIGAGDADISYADVMDQNQLANLRALEQLGGFESQFDVGERSGNVGLQFNPSDLQLAIDQAEKEYQRVKTGRVGDAVNYEQLIKDVGDRQLASDIASKSYADLMALQEGRQTGAELFSDRIGSIDKQMKQEQSVFNDLRSKVEGASRLEQERDSWKSLKNNLTNQRKKLENLQQQRELYSNFNVNRDSLLQKTISDLQNQYGADRTFGSLTNFRDIRRINI